MATHSDILAWRSPWTEEGAWRVTVHGVANSQSWLRFTFSLSCLNSCIFNLLHHYKISNCWKFADSFLIHYSEVFVAVVVWVLVSAQFSSVQLLSHVWLFATPWTAPRQASLSITNSQSLLQLMSIESVMPSNHLILSSPSPAFNLSQHQGLFKWVSSSHQVTKVLAFQLQHQSF